ncbi:MAG: hypothetical protein Greene041619_658 [Candidatus Peregrinibacteria bacterium Greene0416_19]|nr:MAG: hypothetical protein Greene041619_658 [Candidatus Peregrinibacteria bacterium Greene0416_19]
MSLLRTYLFLIPLLVLLLAEVTKAAVARARTGTWHDKIFHPGGMPSSHSAFVTSLLIIVERKLSTESIEFAIAFCFACIVWYDAVMVRGMLGKQAEILNHLQPWRHLRTRLGHSLPEVAGGILFGAVVTWIGIAVSA